MSPNKATYSLVFCGAPSSGTGSFKRPGGKGRRRRGSLRGRGAPGRPPPGGQRDRGRPPPAAAERRRVQHRGADSSRRPRCGERPALGPAGGGSAPPASGGENGEGGGQGEGSIAPTERERESCSSLLIQRFTDRVIPLSARIPCLWSPCMHHIDYVDECTPLALAGK